MDTYYLRADFFDLEVKSQNQVIQEVRVLKASPPQASLFVPAFLNSLQEELKLFSQGQLFQFTLGAEFKLEMTEFQKQVYSTLRSTLPGETLTYKQLAEKCNRPLAARAVGSAMRKNPFPLIIPCHRVIPSHGKSLGRYSGSASLADGEKTKQELLALEKMLAQQAL